MRAAPRLTFASALIAVPLLLASCDSDKSGTKSDAPTTKGEPANEGGGNAEGGAAIDPPNDTDRPPAEKYGAPPPPDDLDQPIAEGGEEIAEKPDPDERIEAPRYGAPPPPADGPDSIDPVPDERPAARKYGAPPSADPSLK